MEKTDFSEIMKAVASGLDLSKFNGDVVMYKHVEKEMNIAEGGIGEQHIHYGSDGNVAKRVKGDEDVSVLLDGMLEEKGEDEKYVFSDQYLWYAVYRVFNEKLNYAASMSDFFRQMQKLGYDNARVKCAYTSLKQGSQDCPKLSVSVDKWDNYKNLSDKYKKQCEIAYYLLKKLGFKD